LALLNNNLDDDVGDKDVKVAHVRPLQAHVEERVDVVKGARVDRKTLPQFKFSSKIANV